METIRDITFGLWGEELSHTQAVQRIVNAGFPIKGGIALTMFAIVEGESGEYLRAFNLNLLRDGDGNIVRSTDAEGREFMTVKSIDMGFMQFNVPVMNVKVEMTKPAVKLFVDDMFEQHPDLARADKSAERAYELWSHRGFQPWYAYQPGTDKFRLKKRYGSIAFGQWLVNSFVGKDEATGKVPRVGFVS